jgi:hypothetical protein
MHAEELRKEWESSRQQQAPGEDPSQRYGTNNYGQRPHKPEGSEHWAMTPTGTLPT